jgi:hypothetical protein
VADVLSRADGAARTPDDADDAGQNQSEADSLPGCEGLMQEGDSEQRDYQRDSAGEESTRMGRRGEQQSGIHEQHHGRAAAKHNGSQPDPAEALDRKPLAQQVGQQEQSADAEPERRNVPRREARTQAEACHDDPSGPDAGGSEAIECATCEFGRGRVRHQMALRAAPSDANPTRRLMAAHAMRVPDIGASSCRCDPFLVSCRK